MGVHLFRGGDLTCKRGLKDRVWGILGSFRHHSVSHVKTWEFFEAKDFNWAMSKIMVAAAWSMPGV